VKSDSLTVKEAATRLGITTTEMEAVVKGGKIKTMTAGWRWWCHE
jgi:hypothetical protein